MKHISETIEPEIQKIVDQLRQKLLRQEASAESTRKHIQLLTAKQGELFDEKGGPPK